MSARQRRTVSRDLLQLMREREKLRVIFVELNEACKRAEDDDTISVEAFADMGERRNEALNALNIDASGCLHDHISASATVWMIQ